MKPPEEKRKVGRPQRYVLWNDWERWMLREWNPLAHNDLPHMKTDIAWLKRLMIGLLFVFVTGAIAIVVALAIQ